VVVGEWNNIQRCMMPKLSRTLPEILSVDKFNPQGMSYGIHLKVRLIRRHFQFIGPAWYIENQDVKLSAKDKIEVKGSESL
jgi:hypothetical protein